MGSIGLPEILVVLVVALLVLGPQRLPEAARQLGKAMAELRRVSTDLQAEVRDAFSDSPPTYPPQPTMSGPARTEEAAAPAAATGPEPAPEAGGPADGIPPQS